jgi:hypothetical protein
VQTQLPLSASAGKTEFCVTSYTQSNYCKDRLIIRRRRSSRSVARASQECSSACLSFSLLLGSVLKEQPRRFDKPQAPRHRQEFKLYQLPHRARTKNSQLVTYTYVKEAAAREK